MTSQDVVTAGLNVMLVATSASLIYTSILLRRVNKKYAKLLEDTKELHETNIQLAKTIEFVTNMVTGEVKASKEEVSKFIDSLKS